MLLRVGIFEVKPFVAWNVRRVRGDTRLYFLPFAAGLRTCQEWSEAATNVGISSLKLPLELRSKWPS